MNSRELHQKVRSCRPSSDSTSAVTSAAGTSKVNPTYGDTIAVGAQQVVRATALQHNYRRWLCSWSNSIRRSGLAHELVASLEGGLRRDRICARVDTECGSGTRRIAVDYVVEILARFYVFLAVRRRPVRRRRRGRSTVIARVAHAVAVAVGVDRSRRTSAGGERQYVYERVSTRSCLVGLHAYHDAPRRSVHVKRVELGSTTVGYVLRFGEGAVDAHPKRGGATRLSSTGQ